MAATSALTICYVPLPVISNYYRSSDQLELGHHAMQLRPPTPHLRRIHLERYYLKFMVSVRGPWPLNCFIV
jgi:hypothetical protein